MAPKKVSKKPLGPVQTSLSDFFKKPGPQPSPQVHTPQVIPTSSSNPPPRPLTQQSLQSIGRPAATAPPRPAKRPQQQDVVDLTAEGENDTPARQPLKKARKSTDDNIEPSQPSSAAFNRAVAGSASDLGSAPPTNAFAEESDVTYSTDRPAFVLQPAQEDMVASEDEPSSKKTSRASQSRKIVESSSEDDEPDVPKIARKTTRPARVTDSGYANTPPVTNYFEPASDARRALNVLDVNVAAGRLARPPSAVATIPRHMLIFNNLYDICAMDVDRGLDKFAARFSKARLLAIIDASFRAPTKNIMRDDDYANKQRLLDIGSNIQDTRPGWYMDAVTDSELVDWYKTYLGQAGHLGQRIGYHTRINIIVNGTALHYRVLRMKKSRRSNYVILATWTEDGPIDDDLKNFIELFVAVLFEALPRQTLIKYLPVGTQLRQPERGLMVANPLSQVHQRRANSDGEKKTEKTKATILAMPQLNESTDPEIVKHYNEACDLLRSAHYIPSIDAQRAKSDKAHLYRGPENEFEAYVYIICTKCKLESSIKLDPAPIYCIETGHYLVRQVRHCPIPGAKKGSRDQKEKVVFYPIDGRPTKSYSWLGKHKSEPKSINQSVNNASWKKAIAQQPDDAQKSKDMAALKTATDKARVNKI